MTEPKKAGLAAVWLWLWDNGDMQVTDEAPVADDLTPDPALNGMRVIGSTLVSSVLVTEGVFGNQDPGQHEVYGESTAKLRALIEAVQHVITTLSNDPATHGMLQEAIDAAEGIES